MRKEDKWLARIKVDWFTIIKSLHDGHVLSVMIEYQAFPENIQIHRRLSRNRHRRTSKAFCGFILQHSLFVTLIYQVHHHPDCVEFVHADFVFLLLARQNQRKLLLSSCFVRRFGIAHASMTLRSLNHNLDHHILAFFLPNPQGKQKERNHEAIGIFKK